MDPLFYSKTVTYDTTVAAGAAPGCTRALRAAFHILTVTINADGEAFEKSPGVSLDDVTAAMGICPGHTLNTTADVAVVRDWAAAAFDMMAMGNYPYASSYMLNGNGELPPFPMRVACDEMMAALDAEAPDLADELTVNDEEQHGMDALKAVASAEHALALLRGLRAATAVWYNYSGALQPGHHRGLRQRCVCASLRCLAHVIS